jgi:hypothetical protein
VGDLVDGVSDVEVERIVELPRHLVGPAQNEEVTGIFTVSIVVVLLVAFANL